MFYSWSPPYFQQIKLTFLSWYYLGSLGFTSLPLWYHFTLASGLSTLHFMWTFLFVFPFRSFRPFAIPYSGSAAARRIFTHPTLTTTQQQQLAYVQLRGNPCRTGRCTLSQCRCNVHRPPSWGSWWSACTSRSPRLCPSSTLDLCSTPVSWSE